MSATSLQSSSVQISTGSQGHTTTVAVPTSEDTVEPTLEDRLQDAEELKAEGNDYFRQQKWDEAIFAYRSALGQLPRKREPRQRREKDKGKGKGREVDVESSFPDDDDDNDNDAVADQTTLRSGPSNTDVHTGTPTASSSTEAASEEPEDPPSEMELRCAKLRAALNANIGACFVKLGDHKEAVAACTTALKDDPHYVKALQRRAASNETLNTWTSLASAQEDYNTLLSLLPSGSSQSREVQRSLTSLKPRVEAAQKRETDEMFGKLKGLGNSILGHFGMSTDNFQFTPNGEGGYSMNFVN